MSEDQKEMLKAGAAILALFVWFWLCMCFVGAMGGWS